MASYEQRPGGWSVRYRDTAGKNRRQSGFPTMREAKAWFRKYQSEREQGVVHDREMTLTQLVERYLDQHHASDARIERLRFSLRHATNAMGQRRVSELTKDEIERWRKSLPTDTTRHMATAALKQALLYAQHDLKVIAASPAVRVRNPDPGPTQEYVPFRDWSEIEAIEAAMPEHYRGWATVIVGTGLRPQEWVKLRWEHVDFASHCLRLPASVVKAKTKPRVVPVRNRSMAWLEANRKPSGLVFVTEDGYPVDITNWRNRVWNVAQREAGIEPRRRPYDTRHTYATWALRAGFNTHLLARRMGTSLAMIDRTYGHLSHDSETHERMMMDAFDGISSLPQAVGTDLGTPTPTENLSGSVEPSGCRPISPDSAVRT